MVSNLEKEIWKSIEGYPNYMISNMSRVKSLARDVACGVGGVRKIKESILCPFICKLTGYYQVVFSRKKKNVHRLIAIAFLGDPIFPKVQVNHINGARSDNALSNLEWVSAKENVKHGYSHNKRKPTSMGLFGIDHPTSKAIVMTGIKSGDKEYFDCALDAVRKYKGFDSGSISRCCHGINKTHKGYKFAFCAMNNIKVKEMFYDPETGIIYE